MLTIYFLNQYYYTHIKSLKIYKIFVYLFVTENLILCRNKLTKISFLVLTTDNDIWINKKHTGTASSN